MRIKGRNALLPALLGILIAAPSLATPSLDWRPWDAALFEQAKAEKRFVILDLKAVWCHWCHVMEEQTYANPEVARLIGERYLPSSVDQDSHPELSSRYGDWGWPATIIFAADGSEIVKLQGFVPPERFAALLQAIIDDPTPGPSVEAIAKVTPSETAFLKPEQRKAMLATFVEAYDVKNGGWGTIHKFINTDGMDLALAQAIAGDQGAVKRARQTLDAAVALIDPVAGGLYQYSDAVDWRSPHYEKIMWYQAQGLRQYSVAAALFKEPRYRKAADDIYRYLTTTLTSPDGAFFTSQDADVSPEIHGKDYYAAHAAKRAGLGAPPIDTNVYARENGWAIQGLLAYANATGNADATARATRAAEWVIANRSLPGGGFMHGAKDASGPYLGDTLAMGRAAIELYAATGERRWLEVARQAGDFIDARFRVPDAGYATAAKPNVAVGVLAEPMRQIEENTELARFWNLLHRYLGDARYRGFAEHTMRYLTAQTVLEGRFPAGVLLADQELALEPAHVTVIGQRDDPKATALHDAARRLPSVYKRLDWWDRREGPLPNPDVSYPELDEAAAFACANRICSLPVFEPEHVGDQVRRMMHANTPARAG